MRKREAKRIGKRLIEGLDKTYDLIYVDYRDQLTTEQVAALVRGDSESLWDNIGDWESEASHAGLEYVMKELMDNLSDEDSEALDKYDLRDEVTEQLEAAIQERESGDWFKQLVGQTPDVLVRFTLVDEDHCWSFEDFGVDAFLVKTGFADTPKNRENAATCIAEASPEFSVCMVSVLATIALDDLWAMDYDADVEITNPHLWLGNPFSGAGFAEEFEGTVRVARKDLRTDEDAFGYGWNNVIGGGYHTDSSIKAAAPITETETT